MNRFTSFDEALTRTGAAIKARTDYDFVKTIACILEEQRIDSPKFAIPASLIPVFCRAKDVLDAYGIKP